MTTATATLRPVANREAAIVAYLAHLIRESGQTVREIGEKAGMSHVTVLNIKNGNTTTGRWDTISKLAEALGRDPDKLPSEATKYANEHPDALTKETRVYDRPHPSAWWGDLPGWAPAEEEARHKFRRRMLPDRAWEGARQLAGMKPPPEITPEFVYNTAVYWLENFDTDPGDDK